jgi:hypothetical protein
MATLKIEPILTTSIGGWDVVLTGLDPTDHDFIVGNITTPALGAIPGKWDGAVFLRNGHSDGNIRPNDAEIAELIALARQLGAP